MRLPTVSKEVCIRLVEDEQAFVCTVLYGGFLRRTLRFLLAAEPEPLPDLKDEASLVLRPRARRAAGSQGRG